MSDWESENVANYIEDLLRSLDFEWITLENLQDHLAGAAKNVHRFLQRRYKNRLGDFLEENSDRFFVRYGKVAVDAEHWEQIEEQAVEYFRGCLENSNGDPNVYNFRGHIGQLESREVMDFINSFYPDKEFKNFLLLYPGVFVIFEDDTVSLTDYESACYFAEKLKTHYGHQGVYYENFIGHIGQAPLYVQNFINQNYSGDVFLEFLSDFKGMFKIDENNYVFPVESSDEDDNYDSAEGDDYDEYNGYDSSTDNDDSYGYF